jgi:hypothetical protein
MKIGIILWQMFGTNPKKDIFSKRHMQLVMHM